MNSGQRTANDAHGAPSERPASGLRRPSWLGVRDSVVGSGPSPRPREPGCVSLLLAFVAGLLFAFVLGAVGSLLTDSVITSLLFIEIGLLGGVVIYLAATGHRPGEVFRIGPVTPAVYPLALLLGVALLFANSSATVLLGPSTRDIELVTAPAGAVERAVMALTVVLAAPVVEEALFRGLLQRVLEKRTRPWIAIVTAAFPFALMHGPRAAIFFFLWSLPLGWIAWRTGSIRPGIVVHAVNNLVGLIALLAAGPIEPESLEQGPVLVVSALLILPATAIWVVHLTRRITQVAGIGGPLAAPPPP